MSKRTYVYVSEHLPSGRTGVVKAAILDGMFGDARLALARGVAVALRGLRHVPAVVDVIPSDIGGCMLRGGVVMERLSALPAMASVSDVADATAGLFDAVTELHAAGFVHTDIKPDNVGWRSEADEVVLLDLDSVGLLISGADADLVERLDDLQVSAMPSEHDRGCSAGTGLFSAPEQRDNSSGTQRHLYFSVGACDVFSGGATMLAWLQPLLPAGVSAPWLQRIDFDDPHRFAADVPSAAAEDLVEGLSTYTGHDAHVWKALAALAVRLTSQDPAARPSAADAARALRAAKSDSMKENPARDVVGGKSAASKNAPGALRSITNTGRGRLVDRSSSMW